MTEQEKHKFIERLKDVNEQYARGIATTDDHGIGYVVVMQTRAEAGLQELIILIQDVINAL